MNRNEKGRNAGEEENEMTTKMNENSSEMQTKQREMKGWKEKKWEQTTREMVPERTKWENEPSCLRRTVL